MDLFTLTAKLLLEDEAFEKGLDAAATAAQAFADGFEATASTVSDNVGTMSEGVEAISTALESAAGAVEGMAGGLDGVVQGIDTVNGALGEMLDSMTAGFEAGLSAMETLTGEKLEGVRALFDTQGAEIVASAASTWDAVQGAYTQGLGTLEQLSAGMLSALKGSFESGLGGIRSTVSGKLGEIARVARERFGALNGEARSWGRDMMANYASGIRGGMGAVRSAVDAVTGYVRANLHFSSPDEGPLKDFGTYAPDMMATFAEGVRDNAGMVRREIERAFDFGGDIAASGFSGAMGGQAAPREIIVPRADTRPIEITVKLADDTVLGRAIYRMNEAEAQRVGPKLVTGVR